MMIGAIHTKLADSYAFATVLFLYTQCLLLRIQITPMLCITLKKGRKSEQFCLALHSFQSIVLRVEF